jgi:murein DD-endopeptidase MepM/ murein hydrolase activator NlpD
MSPKKLQRKLERMRADEARERRRVRWSVWVLVSCLGLIFGLPCMVWKFSDHTVRPSDQQLSLDSLIMLPKLWQAVSHPAPPVAQPVSPDDPAVMYAGREGIAFRSSANVAAGNVKGRLKFGAKVTVVDIVKGQSPDKKYGTAPWYKLDNGAYVPAKNIYKAGKLPTCVLPFSAASDWHVSSEYKYRTYPNPEFHRGVDFGAAGGTPILAVAGGIVIASGPAQGFGYWTRVKDAKGRVWTYGHVDKSSLLPVGTKVKVSRRVAKVGYGIVGHSTGPHLHLGVSLSTKRGRDGMIVWTNPRTVLATCGVELPPKT